MKAEPDVAFRDELAVLARRAPGVRVYVTLSRGEPTPGFLTGRMDAQKIARYVPDPAKAIHLICGPAPMIESLREGLASLGVPDDRIRFEAFEAAVASASDAVDDGATYEVSFSRSGGATTVSGGTSLLDAAEAAGAPVDSMCRAGTCGTCRTRLVSGKRRGGGEGAPPGGPEGRMDPRLRLLPQEQLQPRRLTALPFRHRNAVRRKRDGHYRWILRKLYTAIKSRRGVRR